MMKNIYCISGLAADHTLFTYLHIPGYTLVPVPWVPFGAEDDMASYATKMYHSMNCEKPVILGLSLGGMLATEIAKKFPVDEVILISSAKTRHELGYGKPLLQKIYKSNIIPDRLISAPDRFKLFLLGAYNPEDREFMTGVMSRADPALTKWAIGALLHWQNAEVPPGITHIHGTADCVILPLLVKPDYWIEGGTHIMILNKATEISKIIAQVLGAM